MAIREVSPEYQAYLESETWRNVREAIKERDNHRCRVCGNHSDLQVHHINGKYRFHEADHPESLMTLCDRCHKLIHGYFKVCDMLRDEAARQAAEGWWD